MGVRRRGSRKPDVYGGLTVPLAATGRDGMDARLAPSHVPSWARDDPTIPPPGNSVNLLFSRVGCWPTIWRSALRR